MSEHADFIRERGHRLWRARLEKDGYKYMQAADHLERCEKLLAAYYASHNDGKFGPCECEACREYRKVSAE